MTAWSDERILIWVPPTPGEALDSWLEAYAYRLKTVTLDFVDYLGLPNSSARKMVRRLTDHERDVLVRRTGLGAEQLTAMTLEPYDGSPRAGRSDDPAPAVPGHLAALRHHVAVLPGLPGRGPGAVAGALATRLGLRLHPAPAPAARPLPPVRESPSSDQPRPTPRGASATDLPVLDPAARPPRPLRLSPVRGAVRSRGGCRRRA